MATIATFEMDVQVGTVFHNIRVAVLLISSFVVPFPDADSGFR